MAHFAGGGRSKGNRDREDQSSVLGSSGGGGPRKGKKVGALVATQPTFVVGLLGAPMHGKSTAVKALTGKSTQRRQQEIKDERTIDLGEQACMHVDMLTNHTPLSTKD